MNRRRGVLSIMVPAFLLLTAEVVSAQAPDQQIVDLNGQAMEAYNNLDINRATQLLQQALTVAQQSGISGQLLAGTYLNLGVIQIGGMGDKQSGFDQFVRACCYFPAIQLDPLVSTPDMAATFQQAQQSAASGGCAAVGAVVAAPVPLQPAPQPMPQPIPQQPMMMQPMPVQPMMMPAAMPGMAQILHQPPMPQISQAPLPIYAEVPPGSGVEKVYLYYRGLGMDNFKRVEMIPYMGGYAYQINCREVWEPRVRYYMTAVDSSDRVLAVAGTAQSPYEAAVVSVLQAPGPSLPGASPPRVCQEVECPPGVSGEACEKPIFHPIGESCDRDGDCQPGLSCQDDVCMIPGAGGSAGDWAVADTTPGRPAKPGEFARGFVQLGLALSFSYVSAGMVTDPKEPPGSNISYSASDGSDLAKFAKTEPPDNTYTGQFLTTSWVPDADSYEMWPGQVYDPTQEQAGVAAGTPGVGQVSAAQDPSIGSECPADGIKTFYPQPPSRYCARVVTTGFVFKPALRAAIGYFVVPRLSLAALFRLQFSHGASPLAGILLGGRAEYMILPPKEKGFMLSAFLGGTYGQIQAKPPPAIPNQPVPFVISGMGGAHLGSNLRYRFHKNAGVVLSPEFDLQFPDFLMNIDVTIGPEVSF